MRWWQFEISRQNQLVWCPQRFAGNWGRKKFVKLLWHAYIHAMSARALWLLLDTFVQKVFNTNLNLGTQKYTIKKFKDSFVISVLKVDMLTVSLYFLISYLLVDRYLNFRFVLNTFWTKILKSAHSEQRLQSCTGLLQFSLPRHCHNGCFGEFLAKKYLWKISILSSNKNKIWKNKGTICMPILKVDIKILPLIFLISFSMVPKIEICLIYVLDKNPKKQT